MRKAGHLERMEASTASKKVYFLKVEGAARRGRQRTYILWTYGITLYLLYLLCGLIYAFLFFFLKGHSG